MAEKRGQLGGFWAIGQLGHIITIHNRPPSLRNAPHSGVNPWLFSYPRLGHQRPTPDECICAVLHPHMICVYIGRTHLALVQRLRKHITAALAHTEDCNFHQLLRSTNIEDWYIVLLQLVWGKFAATIAERDWWHKYRRWAINGLPPAVPTDDLKPCKTKYHTVLCKCCAASLVLRLTVIMQGLLQCNVKLRISLQQGGGGAV